ncbi:hypothetical protein MCC93_02070 [Morococcus cerebrosus]|uniref:Uncharacterized protein n=1 Tax=Morococcus cerebrosus TaxID=1056807 RepID=A0A0C1H3U5_9NEIS|nr:hypothetical protein MCC93_02070 [Morococcus cerebrosus]
MKGAVIGNETADWKGVNSNKKYLPRQSRYKYFLFEATVKQSNCLPAAFHIAVCKDMKCITKPI